ncbi:CBS domain-containing protein [Bradyrhizobium tropiciagri]|uniref:CBS domain-containing protein n=1 Tax=Bradyrhizobium tropiciagri TaxID=312253 RepID=UPI001BABDB26|nr:CBS domain-containing protein [Bradyrhizobium tropiciagri]MBR0900668.1 CBS domain-containing protein [Bradyrhizobium tropiciagri]
MLATEAMRSSFASIAPTAALLDAIKLLLESGQCALPVIDDRGILVGAISDADFLQFDEAEMSASSGSRSGQLFGAVERLTQRDGMLLVAIFMNSSPVVANIDASFDEVIAHMDLYKVDQVLIVDAGSVLGVLSRREVLAVLERRWSSEVATTSAELTAAK